MTTANVASFEPVARKEYLDRLAALPPVPALTPDVWTKVHECVQEQLAVVETEVRRRLPRVRVSPGRTAGSKFLLFSYRAFSMPDTGIDPVVVGMTFTARRHGVTMEADVSGEQTGDIILSLPSKTVADSDEELLAQACESARKLCESAEAIAAALANPSRASSEFIS